MPKKKIEAVDSLEGKIGNESLIEEAQEQQVEKIEVKRSIQSEFTVLNSGGAEVRTYSLADHGERAEELAHQFAGKIGGSVR